MAAAIRAAGAVHIRLSLGCSGVDTVVGATISLADCCPVAQPDIATSATALAAIDPHPVFTSVATRRAADEPDRAECSTLAAIVGDSKFFLQGPGSRIGRT